MAKSNKGNNAKSKDVITLRGGFFNNAGPNQQRSTTPIKGGMQNQLVRDAVSQIYFNDNNMSPKQNASTFLMNAAMAHPKVNAAITAGKIINEMLPPKVRVDSSTIPNAMNAFKGNPMKSGEPNVMNSSYGLSKAPNPKPVNLNSGVVPNTYANDYMLSQTDLCSPLHLSCVTLQIPTNPVNELSAYFTNTICFDIQTRAQANVNFDLDIAVKLSSANLVGAFNAAISALQIYFYYASILSYESDPRNKNEGMINLRKGMSSQLISDLTILGKRLEDTPIPPRIVEWVRYMSMNYLSGNTQGAPIIKIGFDPTVMDTFTSPTPVAVATSLLNSSTNINVYTLLRRAIPQWRVGKLYDVPPVPVYDKNFLTIWANLGSSRYSAGAFTMSPSVSASSQIVSYNSFNNKLDGVAFAMGATYNTASLVWKPGITQPYSTTTKWSRRSFYSVANAAPTWENSDSIPFLLASRIESYTFPLSLTSAQTVHLFSEKCQGVSALALNQTTLNVLDFLFNINAIPLKGTVSNFNRIGSNKR